MTPSDAGRRTARAAGPARSRASRHPPALLYRLQNVDLLDAGDAERMRAQEPNIIAIARALGLKLRRDWQDAGRLPELAIEAWRRGLISTGRAGQLIGADIAGIMRRMKVLGIRREDGAGPVTGVVIS